MVYTFSRFAECYEVDDLVSLAGCHLEGVFQDMGVGDINRTSSGSGVAVDTAARRRVVNCGEGETTSCDLEVMEKQ